jgi:hypothetical protein
MRALVRGRTVGLMLRWAMRALVRGRTVGLMFRLADAKVTAGLCAKTDATRSSGETNKRRALPVWLSG